MLGLIFGGAMFNEVSSIITTIGILIIIGLTLWILYKVKAFKPFMAIFGKVLAFMLIVCFVISGIYSYAYINAYYKKDGGIYGKLSNVIYNSIESVTDKETETITYNFDDMVFKQENGEYSIIFYQEYEETDHRTKFENGTNYNIFVNNNGTDYMCNYVKYDTDWIVAEYSYIFYNSYDESEVIAVDTLFFDFCFYENYSYLKITSSADYTTIQLWDAYFSKYSFKVNIQVVDEVYEPIGQQDKVIDGHVQITYVIDKSLVPKKELYCVSNERVHLSTKYVEDNFYILGWVDESGNEITDVPLERAANITVYAQTKKTTSLYEVNFYNQLGTKIIKTNYYEFDDIELNYMPVLVDIYEFDTNDMSFLYWTTSKCEVAGMGFDLSGYPRIETIEDLILNFEAGTQTFNLYPVLYSYY
ncbi:hypothetical protein IKA92_01965 [bacterium]|nr:hypothetical protein [bacterium]